MKKTIIALSLIMSLLMVSQVMAWGPRNGSPAMNGTGMGWMSNMNLTQDQKVKLVELRQNFLKETTETRSKLAATRVEFRSLFAQQGADEEKLKAMHARMLDLQRKLQEKRFAFRLATRKILTPAQLAMMSQGRSPMGGHGMGPGTMGRGHGRHHGCGQGRSFAF
ncbi:MAG: hypothetical protein DSY91_04515 [Deltaproteobacteria bacterium]|nr:MAG: hypothetical protein DSY91_04515 [Deltaproteobacteria bacterium]